MSQPVVSSGETEVCIGLGHRLGEILSERGRAFSVPAFSKRIGISESTLYRIIKGTRTIKPSELAIICNGLNVSVDRFKQLDTQKKFDEMVSLVQKRSNFQRALALAIELESMAIGIMERFYILNNLGAIYHFLEKYKDAHDIWLQALPLAREMKELYGDLDNLSKITSNLIISHTQLKEFTSLSNFLSTVEHSFEKVDPEYAGTLHYSQAMAASHFGDMDKYREYMYKSLESFRIAGHRRSIGRAEHSVADVEYRLANYVRAKELFEQAIQTLSPFIYLKYISIKDYIKTLLKLKERGRALQLLEESIDVLETLEFPDLIAKFYLLHAKVKKNQESAKRVLQIRGASEQLLILAYDFLMECCSQNNDSESLLEYYKSAKMYSKSSLSDWEGI